jgi:hypothetical protein
MGVLSAMVGSLIDRIDIWVDSTPVVVCEMAWGGELTQEFLPLRIL